MHQGGSLLPSATCFCRRGRSSEKERRTERRRGTPSSYATAPRRRCITGTEKLNPSHSPATTSSPENRGDHRRPSSRDESCCHAFTVCFLR
nr:hypothetical protein Iba_chr12bCG16240 [Ipomoea batatas]